MQFWKEWLCLFQVNKIEAPAEGKRYFARYEVTADDTEGDYVCITHVLPFKRNFEELNSMFGKDKWHYTGLVYEGEPSRIRKQ